MRCLQCGKRLSLLKKLQDAEFCSEEHGLAFQQQHSHLALTRLMESQRRMDRPAAPAAKPRASLYRLPPPPPEDHAPEAGFLPPVVFVATARCTLSSAPPPLPLETVEDLPEPGGRLPAPVVHAPRVACPQITGTMSPAASPVELRSFAYPRLRYVVRSPRMRRFRLAGLGLSSTLFPVATRPPACLSRLRLLATEPAWTPGPAQEQSLLCAQLVPDFAPPEALQPEPVEEERSPAWAPIISLDAGEPLTTLFRRSMRWPAHHPLPPAAPGPAAPGQLDSWRPPRAIVEPSPRPVSYSFGVRLPVVQPSPVRLFSDLSGVLELPPGEETLPEISAGPAPCRLRPSVTLAPVCPPAPRALALGAAALFGVQEFPPHEETLPNDSPSPAPCGLRPSVTLAPVCPPVPRALAMAAAAASSSTCALPPALPEAVVPPDAVSTPSLFALAASGLAQLPEAPPAPPPSATVRTRSKERPLANNAPHSSQLPALNLTPLSPYADTEPVAPPPLCMRILPMPLIRPVHSRQSISEPAGAPLFVRLDDPSVPSARLEVHRPDLSYGMAKLTKSAILARFSEVWLSLPGRRFWATAPADLKWIGVGLPLVVALVVYSVLPPSLPEPPAIEQASRTAVTERVQNQVPTLPQTPPPPATGGFGGLRQAILSRAAVDYLDDFRAGLSAWQGEEGWARTWTYNQAQFIEPGRLALYSPTLPLADYSLEFLGQIGRRSLNWVFRAKDLKNYYAMRIVSNKSGPLIQASIIRYAVVDGKKGPDKVLPLPLSIQQDTLLRVRLEVRGKNFTTWVQEQVVDSFTDARHPNGGVGFFTPQGDRALLRWVEVKHQYDFLGRLCAMFAPYGVQTDGRIAE